MKRLKKDQFLQWAKSKGMLDPRYPKSEVLSFDPSGDEHRFWVVPPEPERRPYFISSLLDLASGDSYFC